MSACAVCQEVTQEDELKEDEDGLVVCPDCLAENQDDEMKEEDL